MKNVRNSVSAATLLTAILSVICGCGEPSAPPPKLGAQKVLAVVTILGMLAVLLCACSTADTSADRQTYELEKNEHVTVHLDGDVKSHGERSIRRELSRESIMEAANGFAGLSVISPKRVTLTRQNATYVIPFDAMGKGKWRNFLLNDGDHIVISRIVF